MNVPIIQLGDDRLRALSPTMLHEEITTPEVKTIIQNLKDTLDGTHDGVAISAPQIGANVRIFVVAPKVFDTAYMHGDKKDWDRTLTHLVAINPVITWTSSDCIEMEEGCLSIKGVFGPVTRHKEISLQALDERGTAFEMQADGLFARICMHEIDHLDGILFIDLAEETYHAKDAR